MPSDGPCMRYNNAGQRLFYGHLQPVILTWHTNNREAPWFAEARLIGHDEDNNIIVFRLGQASALKKRDAKKLAATSGYQWLVAHALCFAFKLIGAFILFPFLERHGRQYESEVYHKTAKFQNPLAEGGKQMNSIRGRQALAFKVVELAADDHALCTPNSTSFSRVSDKEPLMGNNPGSMIVFIMSAYLKTKIPFSFFLLLLTSTFLSLPVPAQSLRLIIEATTTVNARTPVVWAPEPSDGLGQDNSLPPSSDETSLFDLRFVNADTEADDGLAQANVDFRVALAGEGGLGRNEVVFRKPGRFFLRAVSGPSFRTIGRSNVVSVLPASTIKLGPTTTSSGAPGAPSSDSPSTSAAASSRATNKTPIIVGALIGALLFITLLTLLLLFLLRRRRIQREEEEAISRLSFHPEQMVIPKSAVSGGGAPAVRRLSLAARIWGSFSGAASAASVIPTTNTTQTANAEDRDLEGGLGFSATSVKQEEARRPSDTTSLSSYSTSSKSTLSTTDTDPHAQIHSHPCPSTFPPALVQTQTRVDDRELYGARERDLEAAGTSTQQQKQRDLEAVRESVNSVEDLRSPRVLDRSSTSSSGSSSSGLGGTNGTGSSALLGVIAFRNPFLVYNRDGDEEEAVGSGSKPEMTQVTKVQASISIPPAPQTPPPRVPSTTPSIRVLPSLPAPTPVLAAPVPVLAPRARRTVRIAEIEAGRVGSESPKLPPVRFSQAGLGLLFSTNSPPAAGATATAPASAKKTAPPPPPPRKSKPTQIKPTAATTTTESRPSTPTTSTRTRPLPTPTFPASVYSAAAAAHAKPPAAPIPSRPTTPSTARPLPTPGLAINVPLPRTPSPPTPGMSGGFVIRALPPVPPITNEGGLRSAPIAPPTSAFTARIEPPNTSSTGSTSTHRTKRQRYLDLRLSQAQSQLTSLRTKLRRGEIEEAVAKRVIRDLEKQVEWLEGGIRDGGWAKGERDWMEEAEEAGWRRWMRP
ncbi:hypothetical protein EST38_g9607 [Candolleomyces aberdarensis]|uniref:Uncharacterized protein n=1 Tax=Candolleomyces aberdarensis TaxID=2316362 RepID=A0A4Q2D9J7_9AGAR|nr:hypothetical protein EST38_g9607 [Candolleomyces aberdarensis]